MIDLYHTKLIGFEIKQPSEWISPDQLADNSAEL